MKKLCCKCHKKPRDKTNGYCRKCSTETQAAYWKNNRGPYYRILTRKDREGMRSGKGIENNLDSTFKSVGFKSQFNPSSKKKKRHFGRRKHAEDLKDLMDAFLEAYDK